jgi:hypothetical protein
LLLPGRSLAWAQSRVGARSSRAATLRFAPGDGPRTPASVSLSVLLFNRPDNVRITLESLTEQMLSVAPDQLTLSIDGYVGSKEEALGRADRTGEADAVA